MQDVYGRASQVRIWLGEPDEAAAYGLVIFSEIAALKSKDFPSTKKKEEFIVGRYLHGSLEDAKRTTRSVRAFRALSYWTRLR